MEARGGPMISEKNAAWLIAGLVVFSGCTSIAMNAGFDDVKATVEERSRTQIVWNNGTDLDQQASERLSSLLKDKLTADEAVQIALLNNRDLQAVYAELGVAQADLVQAGLLSNPIFDGAAFFPIAGGPVKLDLSVAVSFLDIFYIPLRSRVAAARFEDAKIQVTG